MKPCFVQITKSYPHHETLRGQVGLLKKDYGDGTVLVQFDEGPHKGDRVCLDKRYIEPLS